jgi:2,6-dihydroxypseudooxynicotine hydrolase
VIRERLWETLLGLPTEWQESVMDLSLGVIAPGKLGHMLTRAFVCFGADYQEVEQTLRGSRSLTDLAGRFADLGERWESLGEQALVQSHRATAREAYRRAAVYYGVEAWAAVRPGQLSDAYVDIGRCYEAYCQLASPPIERVEIPFGETFLTGYLRLPAGNRPVPCVILVQGFDTIKEWMAPITRMAVERGVATLSVDMPGNGEALARGLPLGTPAEAEAVAAALCAFLHDHPRVQAARVGVFGFSIGGFVALVMASTMERLGACATLGAPFDFSFLDRCSPMMLRRATFATGFDSLETIRHVAAGVDLRPYVPRLRGPLLVVHGDADEIVPVRHAELIHHYAQSPKALQVFDKADHMVSNVLRTQALPLVFDWLSDELLAQGSSRRRG